MKRKFILLISINELSVFIGNEFVDFFKTLWMFLAFAYTEKNSFIITVKSRLLDVYLLQ